MVSKVPDAFAVVLVNLLVAVVSELILYAWVYRTPAFKSVKVGSGAVCSSSLIGWW